MRNKAFLVAECLTLCIGSRHRLLIPSTCSSWDLPLPHQAFLVQEARTLVAPPIRQVLLVSSFCAQRFLLVCDLSFHHPSFSRAVKIALPTRAQLVLILGGAAFESCINADATWRASFITIAESSTGFFVLACIIGGASGMIGVYPRCA